LFRKDSQHPLWALALLFVLLAVFMAIRRWKGRLNRGMINTLAKSL
jgi:hypothetical protein